MPDGEDGGDVAHPPRQNTFLACLRAHLFHPKTKREKILCSLFWICTATGIVLALVVGLPKFFSNIVKPFLAYCERKFNKPTIAAIVLGALSLLPVILCPWHIFVWLAAATLGPGWALLVTLVGTTIGMALPFLLCKWLVQDRVHNWAMKRDWVHALYLATEEAGPFKVMLLMRLGPFPHQLLNYVAATSRDVGFFPYITGSFVGNVPDCVIQVFVGNSFGGIVDAVAGKPATPGQIVSIVLPLVFGIVVAVLGWIFAKRALDRIRVRAELHHPERAHSLDFQSSQTLAADVAIGGSQKDTWVRGEDLEMGGKGTLGRRRLPSDAEGEVGEGMVNEDGGMNVAVKAVSRDGGSVGEYLKPLAKTESTTALLSRPDTPGAAEAPLRTKDDVAKPSNARRA